MALLEELNRSQGIFHFAFAGVMDSLAESRAAEIETQDLTTKPEKSFGGGKDHFVMHGSLKQRMRMAHNSQCPRRNALIKFQQAFDSGTLNFVHFRRLWQPP